jgi:hypothetical protein
MTSPQCPEDARAELIALFPVRDEIACRAGRLRARLAKAPPERREHLDERALRCERLVRLLDTRIRLAAEQLARAPLPLSEAS